MIKNKHPESQEVFKVRGTPTPGFEPGRAEHSRSQADRLNRAGLRWQ